MYHSANAWHFSAPHNVEIQTFDCVKVHLAPQESQSDPLSLFGAGKAATTGTISMQPASQQPIASLVFSRRQRLRCPSRS